MRCRPPRGRPGSRLGPVAAQPPAPPSAPSQEVAVGDDDDATVAGAPAAPAAPAASGGADEYADTDPSALTDFRSTLDPYGSWQDDATYGTVWVPSSTVVGEDFTPYVSAGHWVYDDDYTWVSDYSWGWAPFHYGRWVYGSGVGWEWIPGRVYAGAWVSWRYGWDDWAYVGWAPLPPVWCWHGGYAVGIGYVPYAPYAFVPSGHLFEPGLRGHLITGTAVGPIASHTQPWAPSTGGRVVAHPTVGGPPPATLRIQANAVVHGAATGGLAQARAYARPSTAVPLGASSPRGVSYGAAAGAARVSAAGVSRAPYAAYSSGGARSPSYSLGGSHFGGKLGAGFSGSAASAPPARSAAPSYSSRPYYSSSPSAAAPSFSASRGSYGSYRSAPTVHSSSPSYHSFSGGGSTYRGGSSFGGGGGYHGGGGSFGGGGGYHGGGSSFGGGGGYHGGGSSFGGGGGFHGGGGGGGGHSGGGGRGGGHR